MEDGLELLASLRLTISREPHLFCITRYLILYNDHRRGDILFLHVLHESTLKLSAHEYCLIAITPRLDALLKLTITRSLLFDSFTPYPFTATLKVHTTTERSS